MKDQFGREVQQRHAVIEGGVRADQNKLIGIELTYEDYNGRQELKMIAVDDLVFPSNYVAQSMNARLQVTFHMSNGDRNVTVPLS